MKSRDCRQKCDPKLAKLADDGKEAGSATAARIGEALMRGESMHLAANQAATQVKFLSWIPVQYASAG